MEELRYTPVAEGSSDRSLLPILDWLLRHNGVRCPIQSEWADLGELPLPESPKLSDISELALTTFPAICYLSIGTPTARPVKRAFKRCTRP